LWVSINDHQIGPHRAERARPALFPLPDLMYRAKARGTRLGGVRANHKPFTAKARAMGPKVVAARAKQRAGDLASIIADLRETGVTSQHAIAAALNERAIPTASGTGRWHATMVGRLLARLPQ
jgi:hypothetical protein